MLFNNPFAEISVLVSPQLMQVFVIFMILMVILGTLLDVINKKNVKYFFKNAKKAKQNAERELSGSEKASVIFKTISSDILTTSELGAGKRRMAHLLGMYGTILFWVSSVVMIFCYSSISLDTPIVWPILWHIGAFMTCIGGFWFWLFLRVDVYAEAYPWYRIIQADLFILSLLASALLGIMWSFFQSIAIYGLDNLFFILFALSNIVLFGGVYWSKFAHMFYKPGAAMQKNLAEADGSMDNLPPPADAPEQFGLGIKREAPKHY